jgi:hypothetical protein
VRILAKANITRDIKCLQINLEAFEKHIVDYSNSANIIFPAHDLEFEKTACFNGKL